MKMKSNKLVRGGGLMVTVFLIRLFLLKIYFFLGMNLKKEKRKNRIL